MSLVYLVDVVRLDLFLKLMNYGGNTLPVKGGHLKADLYTPGSWAHLDHSNLKLIDRNGGEIS